LDSKQKWGFELTPSCRYNRVVVAGTLTAFLAACTESIPMHRSDAIQMHEFHEDMRVRLNNGKTYDTKRMTVNHATVTIYELKRRWRSDNKLDEPIVIPMSDVDTIERFQYDHSNSIATTVVIVVPVVLIAIVIVALSTWD
jgi:hypothetical protein